MSGNKDNQAEAGQKKGKGLLIGILAVVLAGGAGAGWFFLRPPADPEAETQALYAPSREPIFVTLDPFTVNLADEGGERMAQMTVVLQMLNKHSEDTLKKHLPAVRNDLLLLISSQKSAQILSRKGKEKLAEEIADHTADVLGWDKEDEARADEEAAPGKSRNRGRSRVPVPRPVLAVHFNQFLVQ